ncbi:MAG: DUF202 domain-containing protein [Nocardiopsaceae bacterium]|jgi:uncharacterized membrane protein YidH (DUF202 family)|nr:DUF202 domain-containing protein [Nocardiopsaceae bacterium]
MSPSDGTDEPRPAEPADDDDSHPGLASERTDLAWTRSSIAFLALGAAILKIRPVVGIPVMALGALIWLGGYVSPRRSRAILASRRTLLVTIAVTSLAVVAVVLTLVGPPSRGLRP